mmetsp:Transcript_34998/g.89428  ORF Transcript_34998/g.89428 Transcript_34998/m.89428 type:complete len:210 (-) Transcript_34998:1530-2159(-)
MLHFVASQRRVLGKIAPHLHDLGHCRHARWHRRHIIHDLGHGGHARWHGRQIIYHPVTLHECAGRHCRGNVVAFGGRPLAHLVLGGVDRLGSVRGFKTLELDVAVLDRNVLTILVLTVLGQGGSRVRGDIGVRGGSALRHDVEFCICVPKPVNPVRRKHFLALLLPRPRKHPPQAFLVRNRVRGLPMVDLDAVVAPEVDFQSRHMLYDR